MNFECFFQWLKGGIVSAFNNPSISALFGAFAAFILVFITDHIREVRKKNSLLRLIYSSLDLIDKKIETSRSNIEQAQRGSVSPAPIMKFPAEQIERKSFEVIEKLNIQEIHSVNIICYWMTSIDWIFDRIHKSIVPKLKENHGNVDVEKKLIEEIITEFEDAVINLETLRKMTNLFKQRDYEEINKLRIPHPEK